MVFSYLDMGFLASIGLLLSVGLLAYGRPYIFKQIWDFRKRLLPRGRDLQPAAQPSLFQKLSAVRARFRKRITQPEESSPEIEASLSDGEDGITDLAVDLPAGKPQKNEVESLV